MNNNIRIGKISAIDYASGLVRVVYHDKDDAVTGLIPLLSSEYFMPQVGDQVIVLHLSNGTEAGVVLGRPWSEKNKPPESGEGIYRKELSHENGKAYIRYEGGVFVGGVCPDGKAPTGLPGNAVVVAAGGTYIAVSADGVKINGNVTVTGSLTSNE